LTLGGEKSAGPGLTSLLGGHGRGGQSEEDTERYDFKGNDGAERGGENLSPSVKQKSVGRTISGVSEVYFKQDGKPKKRGGRRGVQKKMCWDGDRRGKKNENPLCESRQRNRYGYVSIPEKEIASREWCCPLRAKDPHGGIFRTTIAEGKCSS